MNKKFYRTPSVLVITVTPCHLLDGSPVTTPVGGGGDTPPGGWGPGQSRSYDEDWDD